MNFTTGGEGRGDLSNKKMYYNYSAKGLNEGPSRHGLLEIRITRFRMSGVLLYKLLVSDALSLGYQQDSCIRNYKKGCDCKSLLYFVVLLCSRRINERSEVTVLYL